MILIILAECFEWIALVLVTCHLYSLISLLQSQFPRNLLPMHYAGKWHYFPLPETRRMLSRLFFFHFGNLRFFHILLTQIHL
ncbi:hypothetical protein MUK42_34452 [Musa troglodytarum]|uniref:Uncharacterized protein n=1 Tax=Musa troglodytarum TaxID=320322 RepID=A0A9E7F5Z2_9LILI|nr:hypothetical protein MUK42_34452 [Musa troglodytarum]